MQNRPSWQGPPEQQAPPYQGAPRPRAVVLPPRQGQAPVPYQNQRPGLIVQVEPPAPAPAEQPNPSLWPVAVGAAIFVGVAAALLVIPQWVPALGGSIAGVDPKAYWYLSRATALTAFGLLWISTASGVMISNKVARIWPGAFTAFDLHQFTSILGLGFGVMHALLLLGDHYIGYTLFQVIVPFANAAYRPLWVGIGQMGLYVSLLVTITFYMRKQVGKAWRTIHYLSYAAFAMSLVHGLFGGTDSQNLWVFWMYWLAGISVMVLTLHRVMVGQVSTTRSPAKQ